MDQKRFATQVGRDLAVARDWLLQDQTVAIPTETVYGLAGNGFREEAIHRIFATKNRPLYNPLILHVAEVSKLAEIAENIPDMALQLLERFSPGPLTLLLDKTPKVPDLITGGLRRVAVRIPSHPMALELLGSLDFPLAAPSANPFGFISPTTTDHVVAQLGGRIPYILEGGVCDLGIESTVVGFDGDLPVIHRLGAISLEDLREVVPHMVMQVADSTHPVGPGMLPWHYSPRTPLLFDAAEAAVLESHAPDRIGAIRLSQVLEAIPSGQQVVLSASSDLVEAARNLYSALHFLDSLKLDVIVAEKMPETGLGLAINDRLKRASARR